MSLLMRNRALVSVGLIAGAVTAAAGQEGPYLGTLTGSQVNLRTGGSRNHPVFATVRSGQQLIIDREENGWCKVHVPKGIPLYVHKDYVEIAGGRKGVVKAGQLNLRAFPRKGGLDECVGLLTQGAEIEILSQEGEWIKISPPVTSYGYLSKQYITKERAISSGDVARQLSQISEAPSAAVVKAIPKGAKKGGGAEEAGTVPASSGDPSSSSFNSPALQKGRAILSEIAAKEAIEQDYAPARAYFQEIIDGSEDRTEIEVAKRQLKVIDELEEQVEVIRKGNESVAQVERRKKEIQQAARLKVLPPSHANTDPYIARGYVTGIGRYGGHEATHRLMKGSQVLYFLKCEEGNPISLDSYLNKRVGVKGTERELDPAFGAKLIIVQEIEILSDR